MLTFPNGPASSPGRRRLSPRCRRAAAVALSLLLISPLAWSQQATPDTQVGDTVTHPVTGEEATVVEVFPGYGVLTDDGDVLVVYFTVGDTFTPLGTTETVTITAVTTDPITGLVDSITLDTDPVETIDIAQPVDDQLADWLAAQAAAEGAPGAPGGHTTLPAPAGNTNPYPAQFEEGDDGGDGGDGVGTNLCVPNPFGDDWCTFIGVAAEAGENGERPDPLVFTVDASHGDIEIVSDNWNGIHAASIGGNGGQGGDEFGIDIDGARGGNAGPGGIVNVTSNVDITTFGERSHGIFAQSRSGRAGAGGSGYGFVGNGGAGGTAGQGGSVTVANNGTITTVGNGSHGIHAISTGGAAGGGGDGWGVVGAGGSSAHGGNGFTVNVANNGSIVTHGLASHGILAQSIGGTGGDGGDAGGIAALGGSASVGGNGGLVLVTNNTGASIVTHGDGSIGVLAQSIGGGGGNGGVAGGIAAFGGGGSGGGDGSTVLVTNRAGSAIATGGDGAHGVLAQSIGGGGGVGGSAGGAVSIGDTAGGGGTGGAVTITSDAEVTTSGTGARGLFAQSIGGGGGAASGTGGVFTVGGQGGTGGDGGDVEVENGGMIGTLGLGADAIFAESVGGGGGSGSAAGGVVALGGKGGGGGSAGTVTVGNSGVLSTSGHFARGIFAQSVGGGGGTGGFSGALVALGGSGSSAGDGGAVTVDNTGSIATAGVNSSAIQAQSIGGGGGDGGTTGSQLINIGGSGATGGSSGTVTITSSGNLATTGSDSHGIFAQSIGGGGGNGANAVGGSAFLGASVGGDGAAGGNGAAVSVTTLERTVVIGGIPTAVDPLINTSGDRSHGIFAQSIGGGGGNGGFAVQATGGTFISVAVGIGGKGSAGGNGGDVTVGTEDVISEASISTAGADSIGLLAQSIGGGGGNGGFSIAGALQLNPVGGGAIAVGVGGAGGAGGAAGTVDVNFSGSVNTGGARATGVLAQSLGGGGGNGGFNISAPVSISGVGDGSVGVGVGGKGAAGGDGNTVTASVDATVITAGDDAVGVHYQSVGGGGGNGGFNITAGASAAGVGNGAITVGVGGSGDAGGAGGTVDGDVYGRVETSGEHAGGIIMQSIGGGGGNGGFNINVAAAGAGIGSGSVGVGLGGNGGGGGIGGSVTALIDATVTTAGADSDGVLVQSVGGGGGNGGFNITVPLNVAGIGNGSVSVGLGGKGAGGGAGGIVDAGFNGAIHTVGVRSEGMIAQSIGGGGGNGGFAISVSGAGAGVGSGTVSVGLGGKGGTGSNAGQVTAAFGGSLLTEGEGSTGLLFQSVGGGGGNGGFAITAAVNGAGVGNGAVTVGLGGRGGGGGNGGRMVGTVGGEGATASIATLGEDAAGIIMQSIGGGGGKGGFNVNTAMAGAGVGSGSIGVGLGGSGGSGGDGGAVDADLFANVSTQGAGSDAVLIQSVGGGGGSGGFDVTAPVNFAGVGNGTVGVGLGGSGGDGGDGGIIENASFTGAIYTAGEGSDGYTVQSIGGGGGNGGFQVTGSVGGSGVGSGSVGVSIGGSGGVAGDGGAVTADLDGSVVTEGADAFGILFQSVGGGGGNGGFSVTAALNGAGVGNGAVTVGVGGAGGAGGIGGTVDGTVNTAISTAGARSDGIVMQSIGGGGGNGGFTVSVAGAGSGVGTGAVTVGVGGAGADGGVASAVTANVTGSVVTTGLDADGMVFQSVGGGGGNGGFNVALAGAGAGVGSGTIGVGVGGSGGDGGTGGTVDATVAADVHTAGDYSGAVIAQSIGGGGGDGGFNVSVSGSGAGVGSGGVGVGVGGSGESGGDASNVTASYTGTAVTEGIDATAVLFQTVGGGGGNGGFNVGVSGSGAGTGSGALNVGVGGSGDYGGDAGDLLHGTVGTGDARATIVTAGLRSDGIVMQSIGGGGGSGGFSVSVGGSGAGVGSGGVGVGVGGSGRDGGNGGEVRAFMDADVNTYGFDADGVLIQSVGGGGGNGGFDVTVGGSGAGTGSGAGGVSIGGSGGGGGDAGDVEATLAGNVATVGAQSHGVTVQSVGGGGGSGGLSIGAGISGAGTGSGAVAVGVGGAGGDGGLAGLVDASFAGTVHTDGDDSIAVLFQSVGGGGGSGGFSVGGGISGAGTGSGGVGVGVGGAGGDGGAGGGVLGEVVADVSTVGTGASGVVAQSIGGGGGQGGLTVGGSISGAGTGSGAVSVGIGGSGGEGGDASFVDSRYEGTAVTTGDQATAVLFQSIGGGGGQGGISVAGAISGAGTGGGTVAVSVGGSGGKGGAGGRVDGVVEGDVVTTGSESSAIVVQSIGGGGGNGGIAVAGAISGAGKGSGSVAVGIGGSGDTGGDAGAVTSAVTGDVVSTGTDSDAIVVQSLGGGGGNGGLSVAGAISGAGTGSGAASVGVGGAGGGGGSAGTVESSILGDVLTDGSGSGAIVVQSLGGGGGNGGINVSGAISLARTGTAGVAVGVGGFGGKGGAASTVFSDVEGDVVTEGDEATGILAQSLGGGGGNGGLNVSGAISASNNGSGAAAVGVGGFGGDGGNAATVTSNLTGDVVTSGNGSDAFVAQSLGGGGGNGGLNVSGAISLAKSSGGAVGIGIGGFGGKGGNAGDVHSTLAGQIETRGTGSTGILLQSLGGGGGNGGLNVSGALNLSLNSTSVGAAIGVGGFGGEGGRAANVTLLHAGNVLTSGASSGAVTAQSLGGGGGNGGINVSAGIAASGKGNAFAVGLGVGGFGGLGGSAGNVDVTIDGSIVASGIASDEIVTTPAVIDGEEELVPALTRRIRSGGSHGVLAQSIGGGGGNGGLNVSAGVALGKPGTGKSYGLTVGVGGFGGGGGDAGAVTVDVDSGGGIVAANGDAASAIAAQSIGGGGGNGGLNVSGGITMDGTIAAGVGGMGGDGGAASDVTVTSDTAIMSAGSHSAGILAQSIGGGGGNGGINISGGLTPQTKTQGKSVSMVFGVGGFGGAADVSGKVLVAHTGDIRTAGTEAHGILAQSIAGGGGNGALNVSGNVSGNSKFAFAGGVGGHGGAGADAGTVTVVSDGNITTRGGTLDDGTVLDFQASSGNGILAQSIGGGGGNGGMNVSGVFALKGSPVSFGIGGFGSGGGNASSVSVTHGRSSGELTLISTSGEDSSGIVAQSIGGGGGNAGANFIGSVTLGAGGTGNSGGGSNLPDANRCDGWDPRLVADNCVNWDKVIAELDKRKPSKNAKSTVAVQVAIGGRGGEAGNADAATVDHFGNIVTLGDRSEGIVAQSIGGGGGNAAVNIGMAYAGGGVGVNLAVGGAPGDGGTGDEVTVNHEGDITTSGYDSAGIFAQSIGGGGGDVATNLVRGTTTGGTISVTLGRIGGTGGSAGDVTLASVGTITTLGDRSVGLLAQSVGNGGGKSGSSSIALGKQGKKPKKPNPVGLTMALGLQGGAGGSAGNVDVTARGLVQTDGLESHAIFAQSVGGGGGISAMEMTPEVTSSNLVLTQGGTGGTGGTSGTVTVTNVAELLTFGEASKGIFAQSIGGGGGASEMSVDGGWESGAGGAVIALGGSGGAGAVSGAVTVANSGLVVTQGEESAGIHAQSIGGGGGNGELSFSGSVSAEKSGAMSLSVAIGGDGGTGAAAGAASVSNSGRITTVGAASAGIIAQSIGGGGGNADLESELGLDSDSGSTQLGLVFGGTGGTGGTGGNVDVVNEAGGIITTEGEGSHGIFAQSIGGGGGNSTSSVATSAISGTQNFGLGFAMGGEGGTGGTGGNATVSNAGLVETLGDGAHGIFAESIGGGGGNGEMSLLANIELTAIPTATGVNPLLGVGGIGGNGNDAGAVTVTNSGSIVTHGVASHAIVAKSIGGGGGDATLAIGAGLTTGDLGPIPAPDTDPLTDPVSAELEISAPLLNRLGGTGGDGGLGGEVTVVHTGDIVLWGEDSQAIVAQSVNGGGGSIRFGLTGVTDLTGEAGLFFALGADDTQDSVASRVSVTSTGTIMMMADNSIGHVLQSIGGGGGLLDFSLDMSKSTAAESLPLEVELGGTNGQRNAGGDVTTEHTGDIGSVGRNSHAMLIQSIGGGGGRAVLDLAPSENSALDLLFSLGGENGTSENGGALELARDGAVQTLGDHAFGTAAQSIGGGGGVIVVDLSVTEEEAAGTDEAKISFPEVAAAGAAGGAGITLGADGGTGLDGGDLSLALTGDLSTAGTQAHGLFFQSIGAGGGLALVSGSSASFTLGGAGGAAGDGGDIALSNAGNVWTEGFMAHGVFLQSVGGGGGAAFTGASDAVLDIGLSGANTGDGGDISFVQNGEIQALGDAAFGIFAQSLGGGGGLVGDTFAGTAGGAGSGGAIDLDVTGSVLALGDGGTAIFAQSDGSDGSGNITLSLAGGHSVVGGVAGAGIELRGGNENVVTNHGFIATLDGVAGTAIVAVPGTMFGNETVVNFGTVTGSVILGEGRNVFRNEADAVFNMGATVDLVGETAGSEGTLINSGTLQPGGAGGLLEALLDGDFVQEAPALTFADYDLSRTSGTVQADRLSVSGSATVAGTIELALWNPGFVKSGHYEDVLITAAGGVSGPGGGAPDLELTGVPESIVADFELMYPNASEIVLSTDIDFSPGGLNGNQASLGEYVNQVQLAGGSEAFAPLAASLFFTETLGGLQNTYDELSPVAHAESLSHTLLSSARFGDQLMECRLQNGDHRFVREGECRWFRFGRRYLDRDATTEHFAYELDALELSAGFQREIAPQRHFAFGALFSRSDSLTGRRTRGEADLAQLGFSLKQGIGDLMVSGALSGGHGWFDTSRFVGVPGVLSGHANSSPDVNFVSARGRISHDLEGEAWYLRTIMDAGLNYMHLNAFTERGLQVVGVEVSAQDRTYLSVQPALEFGGEVYTASGLLLRPYGRAGLLYFGGESSPQVAATFIGAPDGVAPFLVTAGMERFYADVALGLDILSGDGSVLRIEGDGQLGSHTRAFGIEINWSLGFE